MVVGIPSSAQQVQLEVDSQDVIHEHTSEGGYCYTQAYHVHEGSTESGGACYQTPVYHQHTGDQISGGGCYRGSQCGGTTVTPYASHYIHVCQVCGTTLYIGDAWGNGEGSSHGATPGAVCNGVKCFRKNLSCGKTSETIDSYTLSCTKTEGEPDGYVLSCTQGSNPVGRVSMLKIRDGADYTLSVLAEGVTIDSVVWSTGSNETSIDVTENGTYSCNVTVIDFAGCSYVKVVNYIVSDYDIEPPVYVGSQRIGNRCHVESVSVEFSDNYGVTEYMIEKD